MSRLRSARSSNGSGALLGDNKARVYSVGPQIGHFFPFGQQQGYVNVRANFEFSVDNRPEGWNLFVTLSLPMSAGQ